jgi:DnaJ like chaperone protein
MSWFGKLVGGSIGLFFGGPLGMIAGIAFGHMFDTAPQKRETSALDQRQMLFFVGTFSMLGKVAAIDGAVSAAERERVISFIRTSLRLPSEQETIALRIFEAAATSEESFDQMALQLRSAFRFEPNILQLVLDILIQVALADGRVTTAEEALIRRAAQIFSISMGYVDQLIGRYAATADPLEKAYRVLGVAPTATDDEIKRAYRTLSREFHPDTLASKGMGEEFIPRAEAQFREIQGAWDVLKRERGIR